MYTITFVHQFEGIETIDEYTKEVETFDEMIEIYAGLFETVKESLFEHLDDLIADDGTPADAKDVMTRIKGSIASIELNEPVEIKINGGKEFIISEKNKFMYNFLGEKAAIVVTEK